MLVNMPIVNEICRPLSRPFREGLTLLLLILGCLVSLHPAAAAPPKEPQPIFTVDQVKVGMKGYGLTVFHGTRIEPFNIEVMTVNDNESPNRSVIWVKCSDERMIRTGPVQGMSGSPIYLWEEDEEQVLGKGGRLIGAFAFGYANTNECIVGVQPIEYMRKVGERATAKDRPKISKVSPPGSGYALMSRLHEASLKAEVPELTRARLGAVRDLYERVTPPSLRPSVDPHALLSPPGPEGRAMRMMVPMAVGSPGVAQLLAPSLMPLGVQPFAADSSALGGKPPRGFDVKDVELEPGASLSVPFAWGDADLSGAGTVTDVLPDGTVLGFGHAMDGVGVTAMPMATGYIHFIVSLNTISYKRSGTLELKGALLQDEQAAVAGTADKPFTSAPVHVDIQIEGQPRYSYDYEVLNHPQLTPQIAAAVIAQSAEAVQGPPSQSTTRFTSTAKFSTGHEITLKSAAIGGGGQVAAGNVAQLVGSLTQNPFEPVELESLKTTVDIEYGLDAYQLQSAKLSKTTAQPGDTLTLTLELMGMHEQITTKQIQVQIPEDMPDGETQLMVADAATYTQMMLATKPHLNQIDSIDDFVAGLTEVFSPQPSSLFTMMPTQRIGLALDGKDLTDLPPSKAAVLGTNNPKAQVYQAFDTTEHDAGRIFLGNAQLKLLIKRPRGAR